METFRDDEKGYFGWLSAHPRGFVVNTYRKPSASYLMLHTALCDTIRDGTVGNFTTKDYIKVCSDQRHELDRWAREELGGTLTRCQTCSP